MWCKTEDTKTRYQNIKIDETTLHEKISIAEVKN